jgi:RNA polymerase sigma-70 factor (ECF subfamily)
MPPSQTKNDGPPVLFTDGMSEFSRCPGETGPFLRPDDPRQLLIAAYDRYADELYRYGLMLTADHGMAEDALQQAFLKLTRMGRGILKIESYARYLRTAVRNECWRLLEKRRRRASEVEVTEARPLIAPVDREQVDEDERRKLENALRTLPPGQREVVHLKVYEEKTFQQIADMLSISINTAASRYRYAMDRLRVLLAPEGHGRGTDVE